MTWKQDRGGSRVDRVIDDYHLTIGDAGSDVELGQSGKMNISFGRGGSDVLTGGVIDDAFWGGRGADFLLGGNGMNYLDGGAGSDVLLGGAMDDTLRGGDERDLLSEGDGHGDIEGGKGDDILMGGRGADAGDSPSEEELPPGRAGSTRAPIGRSHQLLGVGVGVMSMCMSPPS